MYRVGVCGDGAGGSENSLVGMGEVLLLLHEAADGGHSEGFLSRGRRPLAVERDGAVLGLLVEAVGIGGKGQRPSPCAPLEASINRSLIHITHRRLCER